MTGESIIIAMIGVCLFLIFAIVMAKPFKYVFKFLVNGALGALGITAANAVLAPIGVYVGINFLTLAFIGFLGLPGFAALLLIRALL